MMMMMMMMIHRAGKKLGFQKKRFTFFRFSRLLDFTAQRRPDKNNIMTQEEHRLHISFYKL